jgi:hypothetical protein
VIQIARTTSERRDGFVGRRRLAWAKRQSVRPRRRRSQLVLSSRFWFVAMARLENYSFGRLTVDGHEHTRDLIVLPDRVVAGWRRREGHSLAIEDLDEVLDELPARLVLGVGAYGRLRPDAAVLVELEQRGVTVECLPSDAAVRRYGELYERHTAAALHLSC